MTGTVHPNLTLVGDIPLGGEPWADEMNANLRKLDLLVQPHVKDKDLMAPPGSPAAGDAYIVKATATGAWAGHETHIARWSVLGAVWEFFTPKEGWTVWLDDENKLYTFDGTAWGLTIPSTTQPYIQQFACSDRITSISVGQVMEFPIPVPLHLTGFKMWLRVPQTGSGAGGIFTVDVKKNGTSMLTTLITIDNTEQDSTTAAAAYVMTSGSIACAVGDIISVHVTQIGDGTAMGLIGTLLGTLD